MFSETIHAWCSTNLAALTQAPAEGKTVVDLLAMDRTTTGCLLEGRHQGVLAVSTMEFETDVLLLEFGSDLLQDPSSCLLSKRHTGEALDPAAMIRQQRGQLGVGECCAAIRQEQDEFLCPLPSKPCQTGIAMSGYTKC